MTNSEEQWKQYIKLEIQVPKTVLESQLLRMQSDLTSNFLIVYCLNVQIRAKNFECKIEQDKFLSLQEQWMKLDQSSPSLASLVPLYKLIDDKYENVKAVIQNFNEKFEPYLRVLQSCFEVIVRTQLTKQDAAKMSLDRLKGAMNLFGTSIAAVAELKSDFLDFKQEWESIKTKLNGDTQDCIQRITTLLENFT
ncbi:unnamed protein product [Orchesella dallaii]|uniref:Uncharacterized protein n=1 Tax=Orchesella dallaii TaxID=48710 RepID=A0ABP1QQF9_9HEXA